jgi:hypothetical protein
MSALFLTKEVKDNTWMMSRYKEASGDACVNRHKAKSISSIAVPDVMPSINRSRPGCCGGGDGELDDWEPP